MDILLFSLNASGSVAFTLILAHLVYDTTILCLNRLFDLVTSN